jgi:hypothetical protein
VKKQLNYLGPVPAAVKSPFPFHRIHSCGKKEKKTKKERTAATTPPKTYSQLHWSYYKGWRLE